MSNTTEKSIELRAKRNKIVQEMHALTEKTSFPAEAEKRWNELDAEQKALETQIKAVESTAALQEEMRSFAPPANGQPGDVKPGAEARDAKNSEELEKRFFNTYIRRGKEAIYQDPELRTYTALNTTSGAQGDYTVPIGFQRELEIKLKAYGGMIGNCRTLSTSIGNTINWPTMDDTANSGRWLSENSAVSQTNPSFGQVNLSSNLASSDQVLISVQLLNDSAFDIEAELRDAFAIRLARLTNAAYTVGSGSGQPQGIVGVSGIGSVTAVGDPQSGNTADNSVGYDDLEGVLFAVDAAYRQNGKFMFNDSTFKAIRKLKDSLGRPLWQVSLASGVPDTLLDKPWIVNYDMASIGASNKSVLFGDFSKYIIRYVGQLSVIRYNELYMPNHQIGFQAYLRTDGQCIQPAAFAALVHP